MAKALAQEVVAALIERKLTLATAETDTGGLIGHWITDVPGCSRAWVGGASPYHNQPKIDLIGVDRALLRAHGSVSGEAAAAMARGVRDAFQGRHRRRRNGYHGGPAAAALNDQSAPFGSRLPGPASAPLRSAASGLRTVRGNKRLTAVRALELVLAAAADSALSRLSARALSALQRD